MSNDSTTLVAKVWNYAHVLRDRGIGYGDYVEQITFLLFLEMDRERNDLLGETSTIPARWRWDQLAPLAGDELEDLYRRPGARIGPDRHDLPRRAEQAGRPGQVEARQAQPRHLLAAGRQPRGTWIARHHPTKSPPRSSTTCRLRSKPSSQWWTRWPRALRVMRGRCAVRTPRPERCIAFGCPLKTLADGVGDSTRQRASEHPCIGTGSSETLTNRIAWNNACVPPCTRVCSQTTGVSIRRRRHGSNFRQDRQRCQFALQ